MVHDNDPKDIPVGLIAEQVMKAPGESEQCAPSAKPVNATPVVDDLKPPSFPTIDPSYREPVSLTTLRERVSKVGANAVFSCDVADEYKQLCNIMLNRITVLQEALMPFATQAAMLANMHMVLAGEGRAKEPAGGTWINGLQGAQIQANEQYFFRAADAIGRGATEEHIAAVFNKMQDMQKVAKERNEHVANKSLQGPTGGPVSGKTH